MSKLKVAVVFGGRSGEHEVSVMSARAIIEKLDREKYDVTPLYVSRDGRWLPPGTARQQLATTNVKELKTQGFDESQALALIPGASDKPGRWEGRSEAIEQMDILFPVIHGTYGEDGTLQGMLEMADIPYVGAGVLASALGMDKSLMKAACLAAGLPVLPAHTLLRSYWESVRDLPDKADALLGKIESVAGYPAFVKPCNLGSSVGISKVRDRAELIKGIDEACRFDRKILIEKGLNSPREIELAVLGNDSPEVSVPGEIVHNADFYDYQTKYFETEGQKIMIPAELAPGLAEKFQSLALDTYHALDLNGLSRVDFLLDSAGDGAIYLNEVNTMPGFTPISMYSMLWKASGKEYSQLLDELIALGLERYRDRGRNLTAG